ncbi:LysR family transcriptional regulator [Bacillus pseudomycoides]|uniref:HTH-type transcriptional regulator CzcR n=1 Tax=Bacillus pseudomycoides TaxID=64104 RepID=A0AAJ3V5W3_9BACI|nr:MULTISPECIES: LysR family transcriptional regulator [Bacillus]AIK39006.1 bacterial regulatory helix-turn-helix, lysR family protein [Bacillus pseudomycoides]AJI16546.1 bacterial regulatory helix-turn-helix, lysR family protein [Bacillus pseudomycoides]MBD5800350.1 transcriptional regulator [Bacillus pseudomycoides]MCR8855900.1 LysR family transcriptional regulator [Bacillus pseudomycoides]MCX2825958.1 LysR family transcriptional regulator [Bacillus sp. DHT2]
MEIKELKTFKMIVQEGTFSLAAKKLNYAQSTVTTHIKKLENELGFLLFERGWDARLTEEGILFAEEVDNLLMHWNYSISQAQRISNEEKGTLRIGILESVAEKLIPPILKYLNDEKPYIHCDFVVGNTALLSQMIEQNKIDFAVCANNENISNLNFTPLSKEQIEFIVNNPNHPVLKKESVEISDIIHYPILIGENSCNYYKAVNSFLVENNVSFQRVYNCSAVHLIPQMVFGNAIGILPKGTVLKQSNISFKIKGFNPKVPIGLLISSKKRNYLSQTKQQLMKLIESLLL